MAHRSRWTAAAVVLLSACSSAAPSGPKNETLSIAVAGYVERSATVTLTVSRGVRALPADSVHWSVSDTIASLQGSQQLALRDTGSVTLSATVGDSTVARVLHVVAPPSIVFDMIDVNGSGTRTIFREALDGLDLTRIASDSSENFKPTSADGIVTYTSYRTGDPSLYRVPLAGGVETSLDSLPYPTSEAALASDGSRLAFVTSVSGNNKIWTSNAVGQDATPATTGLGSDGVDEENPTWSPDKTALVFVTTQYGNASLVELRLATKSETPLGDGTTTDVDPAWSPDGASVAFASTRDGDVGIFLRTFSSGNVARLSLKPSNVGQPAWLADGRLIFTSWANPKAPVLQWIDPAHSTTIHTIPTPAGSSPAHPASAR